MAQYTLVTGSVVVYPENLVLAPDPVTEMFAAEAAAALFERPPRREPLRILELGIGTGAFSRFVLDMAEVKLDVTGMDSNADAIRTAKANLRGHRNLGTLTLREADWHDEGTFADAPFYCIYFNPPYLPLGNRLRPEFATAPPDSVFSIDPMGEYVSMLPKIVRNLTVGGAALIRYPGNGALTFAGDEAKTDHDPWVSLEAADRAWMRLEQRAAWLKQVMPEDARLFHWHTQVGGRRVDAELYTRIGDSIENAPKLIRDMDAYWAAYD